MPNQPSTARLERVASDLEDESISFLETLIRTKSVNPPGEYEAIHDEIRSYFANLGWETETLWAPEALLRELDLPSPRPNVIAYASRGDGPTVILNAHLDTVPVDESEWTYDPFGAEHDDGRLYGRGAKDCKARIAAYTLTVRLLEELNAVPENATIALVLTADEETGGEAGAKYVCEEGGLSPDYAIVEGNIDRIWNAGSGLLRFEITISGRGAHTMNPDAGVNAINGANAVLSALVTYDEELQTRTSDVPGIECPRCLATVIDGGVGPSNIPATCSIRLVRQVPPDADLAAAEREVTQLVNDVSLPEAMSVSLTRTYRANSYYTSPDDEFLTLIRENAESVLESEIPVEGIRSTTDARYFAAAGANCVNFGPGDDESNPHGADESVAPEQIQQSAVILAKSIVELVAGGGDSADVSGSEPT